jgi:methionine-rich copper-binding protein CopC
VNTAFASPGITLTSNVASNSVTTIYGKAVDSAGNASSCTSLAAYTHDGSAPAVSSFSRASGQLASVNLLPANFTITFSEAIDASNFTTADISNSGTASGVTWQITNSGDSRTFTVAATASGNGTLQPVLAASAVSDSAGNSSAGSTSASSNTVNYNVSPLSVTVNRASGQAALTNSQSASFTVVFSSAIDAGSFTVSDITQGGTATGVTWSLSTSDQTAYILSTTAIGGQGTVVPSIAAGRVTDVFGNGNSASTSTNNAVTFDSVAPARPNVSPGSQGFDPPLSVGITGGTDIDFAEFRYTFDVPLILSCSSGSASSMVPTSLTVNVASSLRVIACDQAGNSSEEFTATYNVNVTVPGAPSAVIGVTGNAEVILSWSAPASDGGDTITDYLIQFSSDNGQNWNSYSDATSASTSASVSGLVNGTSYVFKVAASNTYGTSAYSQASDPVMMAPQVKPVISITSQPAHDLVSTWNESAFFEVSASASNGGSLSYQWQVWGADPNTWERKWTNVSGQTGSSFSATRNLWSTWNGGVVEQSWDGNGLPVRCVVSLGGADDVISHVARLYDASSVTYGYSYWTDYVDSASTSFYLGNDYYEQFDFPTSYSNQMQFWSDGMMYSDSSWASSIINVEWQTSADAATWATVQSSTASYAQFSVSSPGVNSLYYRMKVSANWPVAINQGYNPTSTDVISQSFSVETTLPPVYYAKHIKINWIDGSAPSVSSFARASGQLASVNSLPASFTITFSEAIDASSFTTADISNSGTAYGVSWQITDSGDHQTFTVAATASGNGTLQPVLAASAVSDSAGNSSAGSTSASSNAVDYNVSPLSVTVNRASFQAALTNSQSASFTLVFSSAIDAASFTESDITQAGTATGVTWFLTMSDQTTYILSTTAIGGQGTVVPSIAAGMVTDIFGNSNSASTLMNNSTDNIVTFDSVAPARPNVSPGSQGFDPPLSVGITGGADIDFAEFRYTFDLPLILSCSSGSASSIVPTNLTVNVTSTLRVIACDQAGNSSEEFTATYNINVTVPGAPSAVIGVTGNAQVSLSWSAPTSDGGDTITDYLIQFSSDNGQNWNSYSDATSASTSASVSGLTNGTGYIFRVAAVNSVGTGGYSTASGSVIPTAPAEQGTSTPDYYFSNTKLLLHMEGSDQGQSFMDSSSGSLGISSVNSAQTRTAGKKFGTAGGYFQDGSYLSVENNSSLNFGTGAFTIESWVYLESSQYNNRVLFARMSGDWGVGTEQMFEIESDHAHIYYGVRGSNQAHIKLFWPTNFTYDQWHYVVFQRDNSGIWSAFLDGKISTSYAFSAPQGGVSYGPTTNGNLTNAVAFDGAITPSIGGSSITGSLFGYVDDFRVSNIARYAGSFTPPSFPFANSQSAPTLPDVPGYVLATSGDSQLTVSWSSGFSDGGAAISDYLIHVSSDGGVNWVLVDDGIHTARSSVISGLVNGTSYVFKVAAMNANGTSAYSAASDPVAPQVKPVISITSQPAHDLVPTWDGSAVFEVSASASNGGSLSYQWQVWGADPNNWERKWTNVPGATASSFSTTRNLWSTWNGGIVEQPYDGNGFPVRCVISLSGADDVISHVARLHDASSVTYVSPSWTDWYYYNYAAGYVMLGGIYYEQFDFPRWYSNQIQFYADGMYYSDIAWASSVINVEWQTSPDATTWTTVQSSSESSGQISVSNPGVDSLYYQVKVSATWPVTINQSYKPTPSDVISQSFSQESSMPSVYYGNRMKINWIE